MAGLSARLQRAAPASPSCRRPRPASSPRTTRAPFARHLDDCASCRALAAAARDWEAPPLADDARERIARRAGIALRASSRTPWLLPLAAVLALAVLTPFLLRERLRPLPTAHPPTQSPSVPAFVLPLEKLDRRTAPGVVVRGGDAFESELSAALVPYEAGDLAAAGERLEALARRHPDAASPRLYLGVVDLLRGRPGEAARALEEAEPLARTFWGPSVRWYLAVARERSGGDAQAPLRALCAAEGEYRARACAALDALARRPPGP